MKEDPILNQNNIWVETYYDGFTEDGLDQTLKRARNLEQEVQAVFLPYLRRFAAREDYYGCYSETDAERDLIYIEGRILNLLQVDFLNNFINHIYQADQSETQIHPLTLKEETS